VFGDAIDPDTLSPEVMDAYRLGRPIVTTTRQPMGDLRVQIHQQLGPRNEIDVVGTISVPFLLDIGDQIALPSMAEFCVLDDQYRVIACSFDAHPPIPEDFVHGDERSNAGSIDWQQDGERFLGRYWTLFLEPTFGIPSWTVILVEPEASVLAPIENFRLTFIPVMMICLFSVSLLTISQLRKRLEPLDKLKEGTRRIAERDFAVELDVSSGDEFEELAASFNLMARNLSDQFDALTSLIDIGRAVMSALDLHAIADLVLFRMGDLYSCDEIVLLMTTPESPDRLRVFSSSGAPDAHAMLEIEDFTAGERRWLDSNSSHLVVLPGEKRPQALRAIGDDGSGATVILPLVVKGEVAGALVCRHDDPENVDPARLVYARQLADQTAMAISTALSIEENRVLAYFDTLTGLPNRLLFKERAEQALIQALRHNRTVAVCLLDLDGFKRVNDTLGHEAGDLLLTALSERLQRIVRSGTIARLGGDEFTLLLTDVDRILDAARISKRILETVAEPFHLESQEVIVTASIGVSFYPDDGDDLETILRNADTAMYHAKDEGGNAYHFYTTEMHQTVHKRLTLESKLRRALERDEFQLVYQPIVDVQSRDIVGMEALLRWNEPEIGMIPPVEFVSLAEETGLIVPIGEWVLNQAARQNVHWQQQGLPHLRVAVNVASRQFMGASLLPIVQRALNSAGLHPQYLVLELTEGSLISVDAAVRSTLMALREQGIHISVDDFGTGYSSLSYLKHLPFDHLKIDRTFIIDVTRNRDDAAIVQAVIAMGHGLDLQVIAEGVETEEQLAFLLQHGCDSAQGFLFSEPLAADAFEKLLKTKLPS
jgi:diguanylate cyclase (GGDEF)-like protein